MLFATERRFSPFFLGPGVAVQPAYLTYNIYSIDSQVKPKRPIFTLLDMSYTPTSGVFSALSLLLQR